MAKNHGRRKMVRIALALMLVSCASEPFVIGEPTTPPHGWVEYGTGLSNAESYVSVAFADAYFAARMTANWDSLDSHKDLTH